MKRVVMLLVMLLGFGLAPAAFATWGWLRGSAISEFTDSDWEVLKREGVTVLEDGADGVTVEWKNPETGAHGAIKPLATFMYQGRPCRTTAFRVTSRHGTQGQAVHTVCLQADGIWMLAPDGTTPDDAPAPDGEPASSGGARP